MDQDSQTFYTFTAIVFAIFILLEAVIPRRGSSQGTEWRWVNNFSLGALSWYISTVAGTWLMIWLAGNADLRSFALLPPAIAQQPVIGFLLLIALAELLSYCAHVAFHRVAWLWPIHAVHHADTAFDVSTGFRHHPLETLMMVPFGAIAVVLLGTTPEVAVAYRMLTVATTVFSHANIRLPEWLDRRLRPLILTPDFHRIHHCAEQRFTNSNYGTLVPWYDYLFGTAKTRPFQEQEDMEIGLEYWRGPGDARLDRMLAMPLRKTRPTTPQPRSE